MHITKTEVKQLIEVHETGTFKTHFFGAFSNKNKVIGISSSNEIQIWQHTRKTRITYSIFTFTFNEQQYLIGIKAQLNIFAKMLYVGLISFFLILFISKGFSIYQQDSFWIITLVEIIFLLLFILVTTKIYTLQRNQQLQDIYDLLNIEFIESPVKETSLGSMLLRCISYPLALVTLYTSIFYFFPNQQYLYATFGTVIVSAYLIIDIMLLFKKKK